MKRIALLVLALAWMSPPSFAADQTREVQGELKKDGFYFGEIDGSAGPEFSAALRRYQIRNGLEVTGQLNEETLGSLGLGGGPRPSSAPSPPAPSRTAPPCC